MCGAGSGIRRLRIACGFAALIAGLAACDQNRDHYNKEAIDDVIEELDQDRGSRMDPDADQLQSRPAKPRVNDTRRLPDENGEQRESDTVPVEYRLA
jgi:hypothetical protein